MTAARWRPAGLALALAAAAALHAQEVRPSRFTGAPVLQSPPPGEIEILPIRGQLYALYGAGGTIVASVGPDGVLLVDAGSAAMTEKVLAAVHRLQQEWQIRNPPKPLGWGAETRSSIVDRHIQGPPKPIRYVINTHADPDHTGGNARLRNAGRTFTGGNVAGDIRDAGEGAAILAHENVLVRLSRSGEGAALPADALPTDTYYGDAYKLSHFFNGEGIQLIHAPAAHSDGDSLVYFRGTDVIALGDVMSDDTYPVIDVERGGSINGVIDALNRVLDLAIPEFRLEGGTLMVPGHGRIVDSADVAYYRDMVTIIRDRVQDAIRKGMTLDQVKGAKLTADYDPRFGVSSRWTPDQFIEAAYRSLGGGRQPAAERRGRGRTS